MKKYFKSTYSQLTLMFSGLLLLNFSVIILAMRQITFVPSANQMALQIKNQLIAIQPILNNKNVSQAQITLNNLYTQNQVIAVKNPESSAFPSLLFYQELKKQLMNSDILQVELKESATQSMIYLKPQWSNGYWLGFTFHPFIKKVARLFMVLALVLIFMSSLAAYFFSRYMLKPLKQMASMATEIIEGNKNANIMKIKGTTEVREIGHLVKNSALQIHKLNKEKELLLAGVSHDLRTPLARMRLQAEFISDEEERHQWVQEIEEMDHIIGDFVTYVRLGTIEATEKVDLIDVINESVALYINQVKDIQWSAPEQHWPMDLKPISMKRMLCNIFDNAFKYGNPPVTVTLTIKEFETILCIRDHGKGVDENDLSGIFEPFFMAQTQDNQYGSGLGLSIVKKLAQQNNAEVKAKNHRDCGLVITLIWKNQAPLLPYQ